MSGTIMESPTNSLFRPEGSKYWFLENGVFVRRPPVPPEVLEFAEGRNMEVYHLNGQRILSHKLESSDQSFIPPPVKGCEVFIGRLPNDCYEPELVPLLEEFGPIYKFRLMMDFSGCNRGYAFAQFFTAFNADLAVNQLGNFEIRPGHYIEMGKSSENCRVLLVGVPIYKTVKEIYDEINPLFPRLRCVLIEDDQNTRTSNRSEIGFAIAVYEDHCAAATARNLMLANRLRLWGYRIHADWANPDTSVTTCYSAQVLHVSGIPRSIDNCRLNKIFNERSNYGLQHLKRHQHEAVVYFKTKGHAELAKCRLEALGISGERVHVQWSRGNQNNVPDFGNQQQNQVNEEPIQNTNTPSMVMMNQQTITTVTSQNSTPIPSQYTLCNNPRCYNNPAAPDQPQPLPCYQPYQGVPFFNFPVLGGPPPPPNYMGQETVAMHGVLQQLQSSFNGLKLN
ncbi:unnamed protein product [Orchesella dallaii]|uniref:RRM domain-containing protein n=1 Tax=Orchesella dallaii TaxID=48710 RepID=A0ABP1R4Z7_9HEXA